jgi:hypothetical protein
VRLEEHFVDMAVVGDDVCFRGGQVEAPVAQELVDDIDGVVFKRRVERRAIKDFS